MTVKVLGHFDDMEGGAPPDCECTSEECHGRHHCSGDGVVVGQNTLTGRRVYFCQKCAGKEEMRSARDMPGQKNKARRRKPGLATGIGFGVKRRKGVKRLVTDSSVSARGLMSRRVRKATKRAVSRLNAKAKMLACHACNRSDFITEKSLKKHTAKFHTPGAKSPRGFRTARNAESEKSRMFGPKCRKCGRPEYVYSIHSDGRPKHTQCAHCARLMDMGQAAKRTFGRTRRDPVKVQKMTSPKQLRETAKAMKGMGYYEVSNDGFPDGGGSFWTVVMRKGANIVLLTYQR